MYSFVKLEKKMSKYISAFVTYTVLHTKLQCISHLPCTTPFLICTLFVTAHMKHFYSLYKQVTNLDGIVFTLCTCALPPSVITIPDPLLRLINNSSGGHMLCASTLKWCEVSDYI